MKIIAKFKTVETFNITGRGLVRVVESPPNEVVKFESGDFIGKIINLDGRSFYVDGIEMMGSNPVHLSHISVLGRFLEQ